MKKEKYLYLEKSTIEKLKEDLFTPYTLPFEKSGMDEEEKEPILSTGPHCLR